jgi:hypothetical protein
VITASGGQFVDERGREVVLREFNVYGETKLAENRGSSRECGPIDGGLSSPGSPRIGRTG